VRDRLRAAFAKRDDPYAGADLANAGRFGGALWFFGAAFTAAFLPFAHPDDAIGDAGWAVTALLIAGSVVGGQRMRHMGSRVNVDELLAYSYCAIASVAVLVWISGGINSPYGQLYLLSAIYTSAVHPPRRALAFLLALSALALLPLVYDDVASHRAHVEIVAQLCMWLALAFITIALMTFVRAQRLGLRQEGESARRQARLDPLTGLLNRRAFDEDLAVEIERARTTREPLSIVVGDLDDFKDFNDRFGHLEGDRVLEQVAHALRSALRRPDFGYRWGGDEFAVILPQANVHGAERVAQRVRAAIRKEAGPDGEMLGLSTGVAEFDPALEGGEALVAAADQALMLAKGSGLFDSPQSRG
jgi:diguanylate cyclase (GGDEF)-like protein